MSLILDALRKSEAERRRGQTPNLYGASVSTPASRRDGVGRWPILAGGALVLVAVALMLWPRASPDVDAATPDGASATAALAVTLADATTVDATPTAATPMPIPAQLPQAPTPSTPADVTLAKSHAPARLATDAPARAATTPIAPATPMPTQSPTPTPTPTPTSAEPTPPSDDLPTLAVLAPGERAALPPLKLSMHVWNSEPGQRFAIVDGQRLTEGATVGGAVVAEIRRDGLVLNVNGRRVLLPRP